MEPKVYAARKPCGNCPYRKDAPLRLWHRDEFKKVLDSEASPFGSVFGCHKQNGELCIGWVLDQRRRNVPSVAFRMALVGKDGEAIGKCLEESTDGGHELFPDVFSMCRANGVTSKKRG